MTTAEFINANSLSIPLADKSVHMAVTSPPYWALRDYGTAQWEGGDPECDHVPGPTQGATGQRADRTFTATKPYRDTCGKCGAIRVDNQLGLEKLHDCLGWATGAPCGECFVCHVIAWAREVKRVLRDDGTFWLNIGDSYAANYKGDNRTPEELASTSGLHRDGRPDANRIATNIKSKALDTTRLGTQKTQLTGLKPKDMCLIPQRVALALQADGWYVRSDIIWAKPNPMPESVTDRPTKSHEYLWLLTKSARYYWDQEAVREEQTGDLNTRIPSLPEKIILAPDNVSYHLERMKNHRSHMPIPGGRNLRSVWTIATHPYSGAHFATYPPALVEPCIKAGTSERGCCPRCGKQWVRVSETHQLKLDNRETSGRVTGGTSINSGAGNKTGGFHEYPRTRKQSTTLGFRPDCECGLEPVPCTVLDPFSGAATTGLVCQQLGRRYVGLDLSLDYIKMGRKRCGIDALEAWRRNAEITEDELVILAEILLEQDLSGLPMFAAPSPTHPPTEESPAHGPHAPHGN